MSAPNARLIEQFIKGGWLPANRKVYEKWLKEKLRKARRNSRALSPPIQELKDMIDNDGDMFMGFNRMFEGTPANVQNYDDLLLLMNQIIVEAPAYGPIGPPFYMIMYEPMNTDGGFTALLAQKLNLQFRTIFNEWAVFLESSASTYVLTDSEGGWFSPEALAAMEVGFGGLSYDQIFVTQPEEPHKGYTSWDHFFVREFNPGVRPLELPENPAVINAACESVFYNQKSNVQETDEFWIKGEPYSLRHMLNDDEYTAQLIGGSVFQGFLQVTGYHRWHSPVEGVVKKIVTVPGTYFVQSPALLNSPATDNPYLQSLGFITSLTARQLIFIESSNPKIGLMCFIAIGMTEVSTCQATVTVGQAIQRGDELGMFHFGGSSHCLVFGPNADIHWDPEFTEPGALVKVRRAIGVVQ